MSSEEVLALLLIYSSKKPRLRTWEGTIRRGDMKIVTMAELN